MHKEASGLPNDVSSAQSDTDASDLLQYLSSAVQAMTSTITRLKERQRQLTSAMTQQFASIQHSLDARLHQMGEEQHVLHLDVDELHSKQERLEQENANLRNTVQQLVSKVEELDMEKRKRNLLFFGIPIREGVSCEQLVGDVLQTDLGITDNIDMDQARRVASGIVPVPEAENSRSVQSQASHSRQSGIHTGGLSRGCPTETWGSHGVLQTATQRQEEGHPPIGQAVYGQRSVHLGPTAADDRQTGHTSLPTAAGSRQYTEHHQHPEGSRHRQRRQ